jgi:F420-dependent oxidoreductase-like protein
VRLALNLGYWTNGGQGDIVVLAREAERLGYASVWAAEAYGSDSPSILTWIAAQTSSIDVGAAVMQIPARTPATTAMTAATIDELSGGRFRLGLGLSGPQVSEGWHGVRFDRPLSRTREYVEIVRTALARKPVAYEGEHFTLPLPDGPGKTLRLTIHPSRSHIPIYLASIGPRNLELTGEIADGWLAVFFSPEHAAESLSRVRAGRERVGHSGLDGFDVVPTVPVAIAADLEEAALPIRAYSALYIGGMGSREQNFYNRLATQMGFGEAAERVQELFLNRQHREAAAAVPLEFIDQTSLIGPVERVRDRLHAYAEAGVTTLSVAFNDGTTGDRIETMRALAEALEASGLAE